jgi:L-ascorbate metabolism protein UlaG (beta-lactamase superfamily)
MGRMLALCLMVAIQVVPMRFVIQSGDKAFYFAGDIALYQDMKQIDTYYDIDFAILPRGDIFAMGIGEALDAADYVGNKKI